MILLTKEETELARGVSAIRNMALLEEDKITNVEFVNRKGRAQNKAQLKKVAEWLDTLEFHSDWGGESGKALRDHIKQALLEEMPQFASEDDEREFWATHDSTDYADTATPIVLEYEAYRCPECHSTHTRR